MSTIRTTNKITSRKASYVPGDDLKELVYGIRDVNGNDYPAGTTFRPIAGGFDNVSGKNYADISIIRVSAK